jgi:hypothetical protein
MIKLDSSIVAQKISSHRIGIFVEGALILLVFFFFFFVWQLTEWTDEKHRLYLDSLEASFVTELHRSMRLRGLRSQDNTSRLYSSKEPQVKTQNSSDQVRT